MDYPGVMNEMLEHAVDADEVADLANAALLIVAIIVREHAQSPDLAGLASVNYLSRATGLTNRRGPAH